MPPRTKTKAAPAPAPAAGGKRKFTPRAPQPAAERLPRLYRALADQVNDSYFENAKKTCKKILSLDADSSSAFQTLLFLHLHTDDYAAALDLVTKPPSSNPPPLEFERAYCLYRLHREREALTVLEGIEGGSREKHLEAQVCYRLGEYERVQSIYDSLLSSVPPASSEYEDIRTNQAATAAHLSFITREYTGHVSAPAVENTSAGIAAYAPGPGEIESYVPSLPTGWATRGAAAPGAGTKSKAPAAASTSATAGRAAPQGQQAKTRTKPRHRLPKGASVDKAPNQDPDRWLPLRQRASYLAASGKRKGKEQTGLGTQGSTAGGGNSGQAQKGQQKAQKGKKGKKK